MLCESVAIIDRGRLVVSRPVDGLLAARRSGPKRLMDLRPTLFDVFREAGGMNVAICATREMRLARGGGLQHRPR